MSFLINYMQYMQESRVKSSELEYFEMNLFFWNKKDSSHWLQYRENFMRNYDLVLGSMDGDAKLAWIRQLKNFIARDNIFYYLDKINKDWIANNIDVSSVMEIKASLTGARPVVFLTVHSFYQTLMPLVLAQYLGPVSPFALDENAETDTVIKSYLTSMYAGMTKSLSGGSLLKVGADKSLDSRNKARSIMAEKGNIYAAIDMIHPNLGDNSKVKLSTNYFDIDVLAGVINMGLKYDAQFLMPFISTIDDGSLRLDLFELKGSSMKDILIAFQNEFNSILVRDVASWEGGSLLKYNEYSNENKSSTNAGYFS